MIEETLTSVIAASEKKSMLVGSAPMRYLILSGLAGGYVGLAIAFIFVIGAPLAAASSPLLKVVMGASFGGALALVIYAGSELFTGNAMVLTTGVLAGKSRMTHLAAVWGVSYVGNLIGSLAVAWLVAQSGVLAGDPQRGFVEAIAGSKMGLSFGAALARGVLANWLVCLAVWISLRSIGDAAKLVMIFWCLFAFVGAGFEHSIANMTLLGIALFQPHGEAISWAGYAQNLVPVTIGNVIGGAVLVGGLYWASNPIRQVAGALAKRPAPLPEAVPLAAETELVAF